MYLHYSKGNDVYSVFSIRSKFTVSHWYMNAYTEKPTLKKNYYEPYCNLSSTSIISILWVQDKSENKILRFDFFFIHIIWCHLYFYLTIFIIFRFIFWLTIKATFSIIFLNIGSYLSHIWTPVRILWSDRPSWKQNNWSLTQSLLEWSHWFIKYLLILIIIYNND